MSDGRWLTRAAAAAWFAARGLDGVTENCLRKLATAGKGPPYSRLGKQVYYRPEDLSAWVAAEMRPVEEGRTPPRAA